MFICLYSVFFFQAEDGIRDTSVTGVQTCALPISDAAAITAFGALMERFCEKTGLHSIWERHRNDYAAAMRRYHEPLAKMVFDTEIYLKQPSSQYLGRRFTVYLDFMGSPSETDARNYGVDYYVVVFPAPNMSSGEAPRSALKMDQIRHTFLHCE